MRIAFDHNLLRKSPKLQTAALTDEERRENIIKLLEEKSAGFEANGMEKSVSPWIVLGDGGRIWISAMYSTKRLAWEGELDQYEASTKNFRATVEMLKEEIRKGRLDEQIRNASNARKLAAASRKPKTDEEKAVAKAAREAKKAAKQKEAA